MERGKFTSQIEEREKNEYRIDIGVYGNIGIEAPTKEDCLEFFVEVTKHQKIFEDR